MSCGNSLHGFTAHLQREEGQFGGVWLQLPSHHAAIPGTPLHIPTGRQRLGPPRDAAPLPPGRDEDPPGDEPRGGAVSQRQCVVGQCPDPQLRSHHARIPGTPETNQDENLKKFFFLVSRVGSRKNQSTPG